MMSVVSHIAPHIFERAHITSKCRDICQAHIAHVPILALAAQTQLSTTFYSLENTVYRRICGRKFYAWS